MEDDLNCDCLKNTHELSDKEKNEVQFYPNNLTSGNPSEIRPLLAAFRGHLTCLQHCTENNYPKGNYVSLLAAKNGHLKCLKHCTENGYPRDVNVSSYAAGYGQLACLQHCTDNGYPKDGCASLNAAINHRVDCIIHCYQNDYPMSIDVKLNAEEQLRLADEYVLQQRILAHTIVDTWYPHIHDAVYDVLALVGILERVWPDVFH